VVADQVGCPTAACDLATTCIALVTRQLAGDGAATGLLHFAGAGEASWADFADAIFSERTERGRRKVRVTRISTADHPTPARRPANSCLDTSRIQTVFGIIPRLWRAALSECVSELLKAQ